MRKAMMVSFLAAFVAVLPAIALAQKTVSMGDVISATATIEALDSKTRMITLKDKDGLTETIFAGPEVQRFDALKVGDKVTFRYHESVVYQIQKPGTPAPAAPGNASVTRTPGDKPGGTISAQLTAVVTVEAIDMKIPSVTIKLDNGSRSSFKVEDKKNLEGVKVGDRVQITYTQALAISVQSPGK